MEKATLFFPFEVKAVADGGRFTGYASTFGNVDLQDDVIEPGAFKSTLEKHGGKVPILWNHRHTDVVGFGIGAKEDSHGLHVEGELTITTDLGRNVHELAKHALKLGQQMGLSIGYSILPKGAEHSGGIRRLKALQLHEYSITPFPANPEARLSAVKQMDAYAHVREIVKDRKDLRAFLQECGFSRSKVVKLMTDSPGEQEQGLELELAEQRCGALLKGLVQGESNVRWGHLLSAVRPDITDPLELEALARRMAPERPLDAKVNLQVGYQVPAKGEPEKPLREKLRDELSLQAERDEKLKAYAREALEIELGGNPWGSTDKWAERLGINRDNFMIPATQEDLDYTRAFKQDQIRELRQGTPDTAVHRLDRDRRIRELQEPDDGLRLDHKAFYNALLAAAEAKAEDMVRQVTACTNEDDCVLVCRKVGFGSIADFAAKLCFPGDRA